MAEQPPYFAVGNHYDPSKEELEFSSFYEGSKLMFVPRLDKQNEALQI